MKIPFLAIILDILVYIDVRNLLLNWDLPARFGIVPLFRTKITNCELLSLSWIGTVGRYDTPPSVNEVRTVTYTVSD